MQDNDAFDGFKKMVRYFPKACDDETAVYTAGNLNLENNLFQKGIYTLTIP